MIELDGIAYTVATPAENAQGMLESINTYCLENNVKNSKGEVVQFSANLTNPLYIILYGCGYIASQVQKLLYNIGCLMNIGSASDRQIMTLADIAGMHRLQPTATVFKALITAASAGPCNITTDLSCSIQVSGVNLVFYPAFEITIPAGASRPMAFVCETLGAYNFGTNAITSFDAPVENFGVMLQDVPIPGQDLETIAHLRSRLLNRRETITGVDKCREAISDLQGIIACNIFFNYDSNYSITISELVIPPRQCGLFILGYSPDVAETYWSHLITYTAGLTDPSTIKQEYVGQNSQVHKIAWKPAIPRQCWIRVYYRDTLSIEQRAAISNSILTLMLHLDIGQRLSSTDVLQVVPNEYHLLGAELTLDTYGTWGYSVTPAQGEYIEITTDQIYTIQGDSL